MKLCDNQKLMVIRRASKQYKTIDNQDKIKFLNSADKREEEKS